MQVPVLDTRIQHQLVEREPDRADGEDQQDFMMALEAHPAFEHVAHG